MLRRIAGAALLLTASLAVAPTGAFAQDYRYNQQQYGYPQQPNYNQPYGYVQQQYGPNQGYAYQQPPSNRDCERDAFRRREEEKRFREWERRRALRRDLYERRGYYPQY